MSAPFVIPFNNNPSSTTIKTASYTVPSGKYANVQAFFGGAGPRTTGSNANVVCSSSYTATINGVSFAQSGVNASLFCQTLSSISITSLPSNRSSSLSVQCQLTTATGNFTVVYGINIFTLQSAAANSVISSSNIPLILNGGSITFTGFGTPTGLNATLYITPYNENIATWVPSGTVLSGTTTFNWLVTEYNQIS